MKLDLRKTRASTVIDSVDEDFFLYDNEKKSSFLSGVTISPKRIIGFIVRIVLCALGTLILMHVEKSNLDKLNAEKAIVNDELNGLKIKEGNLKKQIKGFEYIANKSKEFNKKLDIMQKIVDRRLLAVTGLDQIQDVIPEEVWLKEIRFNKDDFTIKGVSTTNKQIQNFAEALEKTNLFSKVILDRVEEDRGGSSKIHSRRKFVIVSTLK